MWASARLTPGAFSSCRMTRTWSCIDRITSRWTSAGALPTNLAALTGTVVDGTDRTPVSGASVSERSSLDNDRRVWSI